MARALAPTDSTPPIHTIPAWEKKITYGPGTLDTVLVSPVPLHYKRAWQPMSSITHVIATQVESLRLAECNQISLLSVVYNLFHMYDMDVDLVE